MQEIELKYKELNFRSREAYNTLRTNIEFSAADVQAICITSCLQNEGKSSVSFELARAYAMSDKKTLLIDGDLRKSVLHARHHEGKVKYGLSNLLIGKAKAEEVICKTNIDNLYMVFAGPVPPNPSELLDHPRFASFIEECRKTYDMIIVDTPPLGAVIDTAIISKYCDGAVMVIESGAISYRMAKRVKEQLTVTGCKILGCILNKVNLTGSGRYGKYYGRYYGKYYGRYYGKYYGHYYGPDDTEEQKS